MQRCELGESEITGSEESEANEPNGFPDDKAVC